MVNRLFGSTAEVCPVNWDQDQHRRNRLLAALRPRDYALLEPHLEIVPIGEGEFLHLPGDEIEQVYFLHKGIVSLMAISAEGSQSPRQAWEARELSVRL
jgi:hypothetical protein